MGSNPDKIIQSYAEDVLRYGPDFYRLIIKSLNVNLPANEVRRVSEILQAIRGRLGHEGSQGRGA